MQHKWIVLVSGLTLAVMVGFSIPIAMAQTSSEEAAVQLEIPAGAESGPQFDIEQPPRPTLICSARKNVQNLTPILKVVIG